MQIKIFTIPVVADDKDVEELNHFLRANKIIDVRRELTQANDNSCWTFCVTYMPDSRLFEAEKNGSRHGKIDYRAVLDSDAFARFARMRDLRKQIADSEAVPAYAVFTDAEMAEIAKLEECSPANMLKIQGIGKKKVEKYGKTFCEFINTRKDDETSGASDGADS